MDNNIYTNNVNALQNRFPGLAEVVSKKYIIEIRT